MNQLDDARDLHEHHEAAKEAGAKQRARWALTLEQLKEEADTLIGERLYEHPDYQGLERAAGDPDLNFNLAQDIDDEMHEIHDTIEEEAMGEAVQEDRENREIARRRELSLESGMAAARAGTGGRKKETDFGALARWWMWIHSVTTAELAETAKMQERTLWEAFKYEPPAAYSRVVAVYFALVEHGMPSMGDLPVNWTNTPCTGAWKEVADGWLVEWMEAAEEDDEEESEDVD